jgi:hypothetical protein
MERQFSDCRRRRHAVREYLRRIWHPFMLACVLKDLPLALRLLGEDLMVFRDSAGARHSLLTWVRPSACRRSRPMTPSTFRRITAGRRSS